MQLQRTLVPRGGRGRRVGAGVSASAGAGASAIASRNPAHIALLSTESMTALMARQKKVLQEGVQRHPLSPPPPSPAAKSKPLRTFPNEKFGVDYSLNWALAAAGAVPSSHAFRNLPARALAMNVPKDRLQLDRTTGAFHVQNPPSKAGTVSFIHSNEADDLTMDEAAKHVGMALNKASSVFVQDGALGANVSRQGMGVRVITDDALVALYYSYVLTRAPLRKPAQFPHGLTILHSAKRDRSAGGASYAITNPESSKIILRGPVPLDDLQKVLSSAAEAIYNETGGEGTETEARTILLPNCHARTVDDESASLSLIFGADDDVSVSASVGTLQADRGVLWGPEGVTRLWDSVTQPASAKGVTARTNDLVHTGGSLITSPVLAGHPVRLGQPARLTFVKDRKGKAKKVADKGLMKSLLEEFSSDPSFQTLVAQSKAEMWVVG